MKTNTDVTLYNSYPGPSRSLLYSRTVIKKVEWENRRASNGLRSGRLADNTARIFIPILRGQPDYLQPREWEALVTKTDKWTLKDGDVLVKGIASEDITEDFTLVDLKKKYNDVVTITAVDTFDMGSIAMQHWQVGAK